MVEGADFVTGIAFSSDGKTMYFNEREGRVYELRDGSPRLIATVETTTEGETGLLGIAVHEDDDALYVFATEPDGTSNRILRLEGDRSQVVVSGLPAAVYHNGGGVVFDEDGNLLVSNGEVHESASAQDPSQLGGKVYRFTDAGSAAQNNPFGDAIALGLRNPYGMTLDPVTGDAFVTDNGPSSHDEVNRIRVGGNYGWPDVLGFGQGAQPSGPGTYHDPVTVQEEIVVPTGIAIADPANASEQFGGDLFYGTFGEGTIHHVELNDARDRAESDRIFISESEGVVAVAWGPEGLYYSTPSAIKLVPLAQRERKEKPSPATTSSPAPERSIVGPPLEQPDDVFPWRLVVYGVLFVALIAGGVRLVSRR